MACSWRNMTECLSISSASVDRNEVALIDSRSESVVAPFKWKAGFLGHPCPSAPL